MFHDSHTGLIPGESENRQHFISEEQIFCLVTCKLTKPNIVLRVLHVWLRHTLITIKQSNPTQLHVLRERTKHSLKSSLILLYLFAIAWKHT